MPQVIFILSSVSIVYIMRFGVPHKETYNKEVRAPSMLALAHCGYVGADRAANEPPHLPLAYSRTRPGACGAQDDAFPHAYLIVPAALLGVAINMDHTSPFEMVWAFSIYLEAVAILPQLFMLQKQGERPPARWPARRPPRSAFPSCAPSQRRAMRALNRAPSD